MKDFVGRYIDAMNCINAIHQFFKNRIPPPKTNKLILSADEIILVIAEWNVDMAKGFPSVVFLKCKLTDGEKRRFEEWFESTNMTPLQMLAELTQYNYKLTMSMDMENDSMLCAITGKPDHPHNSGKCLTSRHRDFSTAIAITYYKVALMFNWSQWFEPDDGSDWG